MGHGLRLVLYYWGSRGVVDNCLDCDPNIRWLREVIATDLTTETVTWEARRWQEHPLEVLRHRAWFPPVIVVNGRRFSQKHLPGRERLVTHVRTLIEMAAPRCPLCGRRLTETEYPSHRKTETRLRVVEFIKSRQPDWVEKDGICQKCLEHYEKLLAAGDLVG